MNGKAKEKYTVSSARLYSGGGSFGLSSWNQTAGLLGGVRGRTRPELRQLIDDTRSWWRAQRNVRTGRVRSGSDYTAAVSSLKTNEVLIQSLNFSTGCPADGDTSKLDGKCCKFTRFISLVERASIVYLKDFCFVLFFKWFDKTFIEFSRVKYTVRFPIQSKVWTHLFLFYRYRFLHCRNIVKMWNIWAIHVD